MEWILDRTLLRPRDIIAFVNECIRNSDGQAVVSANIMRDVEGNYSQGRLDALCAEWEIDYPNLRTFVEMIKRKPAVFRVGDLSDDELCEFTLENSETFQTDDPLSIALKLYNVTAEAEAFFGQCFGYFIALVLSA